MALQNILFIDRQVADYEELANAVTSDTQVIFIDGLENGIDIITNALIGYQNLESIQIVSHGSAGSLQLGNTYLNSTTLQDNSAKIRSWGNALTEKGDILFLGCDFAKDEIGINLLNQISQLTGADVAASEDLTGSSLLGGDWDLEAKTGAIESSLAISAEEQANYTEVLALPTLTLFQHIRRRGFTEGLNGKILSSQYFLEPNTLQYVTRNSYYNTIRVLLANYDYKTSFIIKYSITPDSSSSASTNDYKDDYNGQFLVTPDKVIRDSSDGDVVEIPLNIINDPLLEPKRKYLQAQLLANSSSYVIGNYYVDSLPVIDSSPRVLGINAIAAKTEGESLRVKDLFEIKLQSGDRDFSTPYAFDLYLDITGSAIRGSFANTQEGADYKLFYTVYKENGTEVDSRKALPDPVANTTIYKINVPTGTDYIRLQAEDINDELYETTETITVKVVEDNVVLNIAQYSANDKYEIDPNYGGAFIATANLYDNEPIVSLGKVVNPTEGFGYGSTIEGLKDAIALTGTQTVAIPSKSNLNLANTGQFTLEAWIFPNFTDNNQRDIISYQGGTATGYPSISVVNQTSLLIGFGDGANWNTITVDKVLNPQGWNHIASSFDGTDYKVYVNAVEIFSTSNFAGKKPAPTQQLEIGRNFIGAIDEVRIWNVAHSAADLQSLMLSELKGNEAGLVGYWNFNQNLQNQSNPDPNNPHIGTINGTAEYINKPAPQIGYIEVNLDKPFQGPQGLWVKYDITGGTATQNTDYFNSRYRKVSTDANSERNGIIIPQGETSAKIYFSALNDAVVEGDETINIKLIPHNFDQENLPVSPNTYVLDRDQRKVQVFDSQGNFLSTFGSYGSGNGQFSFPNDLVRDSQGNIYVVDKGRYDVQILDSQGKFLRKFGSQGTGNGQFQYPVKIAVNNQGNIYVVDFIRKDIQVFDNNGTFLRKFPDPTTPIEGQLQSPYCIAIGKNNDVYVSSQQTDTPIAIFNSNGTYKSKFGTYGSQDGQFLNIQGIAIDGIGNIYVVDTNRSDVQIFDSSGKFLRKFGSYGTGNGQFQFPVTIGVDGNGSIYVGDLKRDDIQIFDNSGKYLSKLGSYGTGNGQFSTPTGITFDNSWPNSNYGVSTTNNSATITIKDNQAYVQGIILFDANNQPITDKNPLVIRNGQTSFKIKLTSQPTSNVTVNLSSNKGTLGNTNVTFNATNWETLQTVTLTGVIADGIVTASASGYFVGNKTFNFTINPPIKVTEGSPTDAVPVTPQVIISSLGDLQEDGGKSGNFVVNLSAPAPTGGLNINYTISGSATSGQDYYSSNDSSDLTGNRSDKNFYATTAGSTPTSETVNLAFDHNPNTKYLNFNKAGSDVLIDIGTASVVKSLGLTTANDASERDPASFSFYGSNTPFTITSNISGSNIATGGLPNATLIAKGTLNPPTNRLTAYTDASLQFASNTASYRYYRLVFDSLRNNSSANSVQIAEISLNPDLIVVPEGATSALIPILPIADNIAENDETVTVSLVNGNGYAVTSDNTKSQATLKILNDDKAGIEVVNAKKVTNIDGNTVNSYSDNLVAIVTSEPVPNVDNVVQLWDNNNKLLGSVTVTQNDINAGKITFTPTGILPNNKNQLQAILKENNTGNQALTINNDNITVNGGVVEIKLPSASNLDYFGIRLQTKPTADVTVTFKNIDNTETSLDKTSVTFTPDNWQNYQFVTVNGLDDLDFDGAVSYELKAEVTATTDTNYTGKTFAIPIKNLDDDQSVTNQVINTPVVNNSLPIATIGSAVTIAENSNNIAQIAINLSKPVTQQTEVVFGIPDGTALINQDFQTTQGYLINQFESSGKARFTSPFDNVDVGDNAKPTFADLDGDGDLDAIIAHQTGIKYYKNVGLSVFQEQTGSQNPFGNISLVGGALSFADLNNDLILDLVLGNEGGQIVYYMNNGDRNNPRFTRPSQLTPAQNDPLTGIDVGDNATPILVDFDKDGDRDLIIGSKSSGLTYYQNTGSKNNPVFTKATTNPFASITGLSYSTPYIIDWDKDGDLDLFIGQENGVIGYWENNNGTFTKNDSKNPFAKISNSPTLSTNSAKSAPVFVDLNGDSLLDAFVGVNNGKIDYYEQFNLVTFAPGEQTKTINLQIKDDQIAEGNETLDITLYPNTGYNLGSLENYVKLDGQDDHVAIPNINKLSGDFTIETWVYIDSKTQNYSSILELGNDTGSERIFFGLKNNQGNFYLETTTNSQTSSYTISNQLPQQQWVHLAVSVDSNGKGWFYINGDFKGSASPFKLPTDLLKTVNYIGKSRYGNQLAGQIKNLAIWDKSLTEAEIKTTKDQALTGNETGLVAYYQGNLNSNNLLIDSSANNLNGQLQNGALVKNDPITSSVTIIDNDVAGVTITKVTGTNTSETGDTVSYSVKLNSQPIAPVTVYLGSQDESEALVTNKSDLTSLSGLTSLKFTAENWNQTQTFYVKGVDDQIDDDNKTYQIITTVSSEDLQYNKIAVNDLSLTNIDNDTASFIVKGAGKAIEGRENVYSIKLSSQPLGEVRLIMTPTNDQIRLNNELVGEPLTLIFTPQNWNFEQTVRATALDDTVVEYLHYSSIDFKVETGKGLDFESKADNNTPEKALDLGTIKGGYNWSNLAIADSADVDWFKFTLPDTGNGLNFARINFNNVKGNLKLELYEAKNLTTPILVADSSTNTNNFEQISLDGRPLGTYYLKISGATNKYDLIVGDADYKFREQVRFISAQDLQSNLINQVMTVNGNKITVKGVSQGSNSNEFIFNTNTEISVNPVSSSTSEPDGTDLPANTSTTGRLLVGDYVFGKAADSSDKDWYGIYLEAGKTYTLDLENYYYQGFRTKLALYDSSGTLVVASQPNQQTEQQPRIIYTPTISGNYYAETNLIYGTQYRLSVDNIVSNIASKSEGATDLPENTTTTGFVTVGDKVTGNGAYAGDRDWYKVNLTAGKTYVIDMSGQSMGDGTLQSPSSITLYSDNNFGIAQAGGLELGNGDRTQVRFTPTITGSYYVQAYTPTTGTYKLGVSEVIPYSEPTPSLLTAGSQIIFNNSNFGTLTQNATFTQVSSTANSLVYGSQFTVNLDDSQKKLTSLPVVIQDNDLPTATLIAGPTASEVFAEPSYFTVQLNAPLPKDGSGINVKYRVVGGSATFPEDLNGNGILDSGEDTNNNGKLDLGDYQVQKEGIVKIAPGDVQSNLIIAPIDDKLVEDIKLTIKGVAQGSNSNELILNVQSEVKAKVFQTSTDEPDGKDLPANINTTGRLLVGDYAFGKAANSSDKDWYAVYLEAGKTYTLDLENYGFVYNTNFSLYDSSGTLLGSSGTNNRQAKIIYTPTISGNYYAETNLLTGSQYRLSVDNIVNNIASKSEGTTDLPANTTTTGVITVGDKVTGTLQTATDKDWYKVDLIAGKTYVIDISGGSMGDGTLESPNVYLYNSNGQLAAYPLYLEIGNGLRTQMRFTATTSGTYYAEAFDWRSIYSDEANLTNLTYKIGVSEVIPYSEPVSPFPPEMIVGSQVKFDKNLTATITKGATLTATSSTLNSRVYNGQITVKVDDSSRKNEIQVNSPARVAEETVIVELLPGDGYTLPTNSKATLRIQDDDVPGIRIVQVGDNTVVKEGETSSFKVALLSEPTDPVKIRLTPGFEISFVNPVNPTTVNVAKDVYTFDPNANKGNLDINLVSLVTSEKEKTVSFGVKLIQKPTTNVIVEFYDANDVVKDNPITKTVLFTPTTPNIVTGDAPGNWDQVQQVIMGYLDPDSSGKLKLIAKIKDANTKAQIGSDIVLPINYSTTQVAKQTTEITIYPEDWYKLQTVTFTGVDENVPEPGLYHQSNITYKVTSPDVEYNGIFVPVQRVDVVDRPLNSEAVSQTVSTGLTNLQQSLDNLEIPLVGSLDGKTPKLIGEISDKLVVAISSEKELTGNRLKTVIESALSSLGLDFLDVSVNMTEDNIGILLNVKKEYDLFSLPLDVDLGLEALGIGLKTTGDLKSTFDFEVALGFGLNKNFGFYIDTKQTKVSAAIRLQLEDFTAEGNLAFLRLNMEDDPENRTELAITFDAGLKDLDNYKSVKFFDVDGDYRLDANAFNYPIKTKDANGKPATTTTGELVTTNTLIQEPFVNVNAQGITPDFTTVANATAQQKPIDWTGNGTFDAPATLRNEGVYLTKKAASTSTTTPPAIQSYFFDLNRNGRLDTGSKENLFNVAPGTAKWFDTSGKVKPFKIEQKTVNGVITYYFDKNGNNIADTGETLTSAEKAKIDKNNNFILDADKAIEGEGVFVQGSGIAFRDTNNNGVLDIGEPYVNSGFAEINTQDPSIPAKNIITYNIVKSGGITFLDQNKDSVYQLGTDINLFDKVELKADQAGFVGLPAGTYTYAQILNLTVANNQVSETNITFVDLNEDKKFNTDSEYLLKSDNPKIEEKDIITYKVVTAGTSTFLDQNNDGIYQQDKDLDLLKTVNLSVSQAAALNLQAGTYTVAEILNLEFANGKVISTEVSFVDRNQDRKLNPGNEKLVIIKEGIRFVDLDNNGKFTVDINGPEPFSLPNNTFDTKNLTGTGNIITIYDDGDRLTLDELKNWKNNPNLGFSDLFTYEFAGNANLGLKTKTSIEGNPAFPSVSFDLAVGLPLFNYGNQQEAGGTGLNVEFNNINLDFGTFLTKFIAPVIKIVDDIVSPLKPVIDFLNADTKLFGYIGLEDTFNLDGKPGVSILDLGMVIANAIPADTTDPNLKRIKDSVPKAVKFVDTVSKIIDLNESLVKLAESGQTINLDLGSYNLDDLRAASSDPADMTSEVDPTKQGTQTPAPGVTGTPAQQAQNSTATTPQQKSTFSKLRNLDGLEIPIIDNPVTLIRLLLGEKNVDLVKYDIPDLNYYFLKKQEFPLWTPPTIAGLLELYFEAKTDLSVGYDTAGLEEWRDSGFALGDIYKILDGFYVDDWDKNSVDKLEFNANAGIAAGLSASIVVAKAILKGGVDGKLGFDLIDGGELQGLSDGKVRGSDILANISNPLQLFDLSGNIDAFLKGEIKVGVDLGLFEIMTTIWSQELARINIAKFSIGAKGVTFSVFGQAIDGLIVGGKVFLDANLNGQVDENEPFTFTNRNGQFVLNIPDADLPKFDINGNGAIDLSEGRIAMIGGIDSGSELPFEGILTAAVGSAVVTPFTSLVERVARLNPEGFTIADAEKLVTNNLQFAGGGLIFHPKMKVIATGVNVKTVVFPNGSVGKIYYGYELDVTDQVLISDNFDQLKAQKGWDTLELQWEAEAVDYPPVVANNPKTGVYETLNYAPKIDDKSYQYLLGAQIQLVSEQLAALTGKPINEILDQLAAKVNSGFVRLSSSAYDFFPSNFTEVQRNAAGLAINNAIETLNAAAYAQVDWDGDGKGDGGYGFDSETYDIYHEIFRINSKMQVVSENLQKLLAKILNNELNISFAQFNDDFSTYGLSAQLNNLTGIAVNVFGPESADFARTINEDGSYTFKVADFTFIKGDPDDVFTSVVIEWSVDEGTLKLGNQFVTSGMEIAIADIESGLLTFTPEANKNGNNYTHFNFRVADQKFFTDHIHTMTFNVTAVNDAPLVNKAIATQTIVSNTAFNFSFANDTFKDLEGDSLTYTATLADGSALPTWLTFNAIERRFSGTPTVTDATNLTIKITASDNKGGIVTNSFNLFVTKSILVQGDSQKIISGQDNDHIITNNGTNFVDSGDGNDYIQGGKDRDLLFGNNGNDLIFGGDGNDIIRGNNGDDFLLGEEGNDSILAGDGNDILIGGAGNDNLTGNSGWDTFVLTLDGGEDKIIDFEPGIDYLGLRGEISYDSLNFEVDGNNTLISSQIDNNLRVIVINQPLSAINNSANFINF